MERSGMEWKACREQHPGGMGEVFPHINNMSDQRKQFRRPKTATNQNLNENKITLYHNEF